MFKDLCSVLRLELIRGEKVGVIPGCTVEVQYKKNGREGVIPGRVVEIGALEF